MSSSQSQPFRVLVVDDNDDAARVLALLLRRSGNDVQTAHDGAQALLVAASFQPDCIVSDIGMPVMDGYELARRFRSDQRFRDTPLIALTAYTDSDKVSQAGFDHHLVKPAKLTAIVPLIAEVQALKSRLKQVEAAAEAQATVMGTVKDLVHEVREDVKDLKTSMQEDVADLKTELKDEVQELKQELREVQQEVTEIKEELKQVQDRSE